MDEISLYNNIIKKEIEEKYETFDNLIFTNYFSSVFESTEFSRVKTDNYGDAGVDYMFFTFNRKLVLEKDDLVEYKSKNNRIDVYFIQVKDRRELDSSVPNKFIEFIQNLVKNTQPQHYNESIIENIEFFNYLVTEYALEAKFHFHFYYFSRSGKKQVDSATDLKGRFDSLKSQCDLIDFVEDTEIRIETINSIFMLIKQGREFKYTFKNVDKFEAEVDNSDSSTNAIISLIPIKDFYHFIVNEDNMINDKLFESNIRDFKGKSGVNKNIIKTLSNLNGVDFWWLNNGITITVEELNESKTANQIKIVNPQIVNGLQTSYSIFNYFCDKLNVLEIEWRKVFVKFVKVGKENDEQELEIIVATNSQNEIRDKDIKANDQVQKNIEEFLKTKGKYYQRKDKYYTNRNVSNKDIVKLADLAKYINTIYLKDPVGTRNNPGKLLKGSKYKSIFQIDDTSQNYDRYYSAVLIYEKIHEFSKGTFKIREENFEKSHFIHHIVYIVLSLVFKKIDYTPKDIANKKEFEEITENLVEEALNIINRVIETNSISNTVILKSIKEQKFFMLMNKTLNEHFER